MAGRGRPLLPSAIERVARPAARHDRAERDAVQGFLRLRYRSAAPLHVGTGSLVLWPASALPANVAASLRGADASSLAVKEAARVGGRPGLPGSTLRGALRQRHSRMTRSCVGRAGTERAPWGQQGPYHPALDPCRGREVCPTCSLFGTTGFASRVRVSDGLTPADAQFSLAPLPIPRSRGRDDDRGRGGSDRGGPDRGGRSDRGGPGRGGPGRSGGGGPGRGDPNRSAAPRPAPSPAAPRWIEVIPADTPIEVELTVRNLRAEELGALLGALGCEPVIPLICGARRGLGFGRLYPEGLEVELYRADGSVEEADVASWRKAFEESVDRFPAGEDDLMRELAGEA